MGKVTQIISGFPGVGKTSYWIYNDSVEWVVLDSDSTRFSWIEDSVATRVRNPGFPQNYIKHIKDNIGKADIILVSSHEVVRDALTRACIPFFLVYPDIDQKVEYLERYVARDSDPALIQLLWDKWDDFITACDRQLGCRRIVLKPDQFLEDVMPEILKLRGDISK